MKSGNRLIDLTGQKFHRLLVIRRDIDNTKDGEALWVCQCDCGTTGSFRGRSLRKRLTVSCGCWKREHTGYCNATHGETDSPEYEAWRGMKARCQNPKNTSFQYYGARGIRVCARWVDSFESFLADMGRRPTVGHSLDRIDNAADYSPHNCRWATASQQSRNRRSVRLIEIDGVVRCMTDWADESGIKPHTIKSRLRLGWAPKDAVWRPVRQRATP